MFYFDYYVIVLIGDKIMSGCMPGSIAAFCKDGYFKFKFML